MRSIARAVCFIVVLLMVGPANAADSKIAKTFTMSYPGEAWGMFVDLPGFTILTYGSKADGRLYFMAQDRPREINVSATFQRMATDIKEGDCERDLSARKFTSEKDIKLPRVGGRKTLEFTAPVESEKGEKVEQRHVMACFTKERTFIDVHLSKYLFKPGEEELLYAILDTIRIGPIATDSADNAGPAGKIKKDEVKRASFRELARKAGNGDAEAQFELGYIYETGKDEVQKDYLAANKWYRQAAEKGNPAAMLQLGVIYAFGKGVPKDYAEAIKWYRLSADKGNARAMFNIGVMYLHGLGVDKSDTDAVKWYRLSADKGDIFAMCNLGSMYQNGRGVPTDYEEAMKLYKAAADRGDAFAMDNVGNMYYSGRGTKRDYEEAANWYHRASRRGFTVSMRKLAQMFHDGEGVKKDYGVAYAWAELALERATTEEEKNKARPVANHMFEELRDSAERERAKHLKQEIGGRIPALSE
jgi:TPR repeat protein